MIAKAIAPALLLCLALTACQPPTEPNQSPATTQEAATPKALGPWMGMKPTAEPVVLAPELLASSLDEYNGTFSPDGRTFVYTTNTPAKGFICWTQMDDNGVWREPTVTSFSGVYSEYDPLFSPDGSQLFFSSERPINDTAKYGTTRAWMVALTDTGWTEPQVVPLTGEGDYYSSTARNGSMYFNVWKHGDIYRGTPNDTGYAVEALPEAINGGQSVGDPFVSPEEDYLIFRGYDNSLGSGDLYISYQVAGEWSEPQNLGEPINSNKHEMCPWVTRDGRFFVWASSRNSGYVNGPNNPVAALREQHRSHDNGQLNIHYISADFIENLGPKP